MNENSPAGRVDLGRVVAVALFAVFLAVNVAHVFGDGVESPLAAGATTLSLLFYVLLIWAYLRRSPTDHTDRRWTSWAVAFAGTGAPFAIPLVSRGPASVTAQTATASVVLVLGLLAMLWALGSLGTNISVVPQAREVVQHGPYARVRHPLYAAELLSGVGLCLAQTGPGPWAVLAALAAFQVARARREEVLLTEILPGYADYKNHTPMLVPALGRS